MGDLFGSEIVGRVAHNAAASEDTELRPSCEDTGKMLVGWMRGQGKVEL